MQSPYRILYMIVVMLLLVETGQGGGESKFATLLARKESNPKATLADQAKARELGFPIRAYVPGSALMEVLAVEEGEPLYGVITNVANPYDGGFVASYAELARRFDMTRVIRNPGVILPDGARGSMTSISKLGALQTILLVPDWTNDKVMAFDPNSGNLLDTAYIAPISSALASPKDALRSPRGTITVSDQITDLVQQFTLSGTYMGWFAPAGGVNNSILDNLRGHAYRANGNLVVCVASGANQNSIAEFDSAGNYLGNFVANGAGGLNSPFSILFRSADVLISQSSSPVGVSRFTLSGSYVASFASISSFPQQVIELNDGRIAVANFQGTGQTGIRLYAADGTFLRLLSGVTGNRGVYQLGNGNFLTTNAAGIHEVDSASGGLVRTILVTTNLQYINPVDVGGVGVTEEESLPLTFALHQSYPNPFNPSTTVQFDLPIATRVTLKVYDVLGREVLPLVNGVREAGRHTEQITATSLASGIYFIRMQAGEFTQTQKIVLAK